MFLNMIKDVGCYFKGVAVGNFCYKWNGIRLGDLKGNRFKIALRHVKGSDKVIEEAVESLKKNGFINYFGLQRFGMSRVVPTQAVGKAILKGDWKLAVELILKPRPGESTFRDLKEARDIWWETRDATKALKPLTRKDRTIEGKILTGLKKHGPAAYQNAFDSLPTHTVTLYLHAVQSLVWNKVVSRRVRECGLRVLPGDLVQIGDDKEPEGKAEADDDSDDDDTPAGDWEVGSAGRVRVRPLTAEEAESASICDVFYPLPGDDIRFPDNVIATWYKEILAEEEISIDDFSSVCRKYGSVYGTYRRMVGRVEDLSWRMISYSHPDQDLLLTDLQLLRGVEPLPLDKDGPYKAAVLEFNLGVCAYATMAVREMSKCETSTNAQAKLTNQAREEDEEVRKQKMAEKKTSEAMEVDSEEHGVNGDKPGEEHTDTVPENGVETPNSSQRNREEDENNEMYMREAEADNMINKYLESRYPS